MSKWPAKTSEMINFSVATIPTYGTSHLASHPGF
jgi:hypothetical protein